MNTLNYYGAKWWKFDFHTHTPASNDFKQHDGVVEITPEYWLKKFVAKKINCIAITDHNSGDWIDKLKTANNKLATPLSLFPGVEISVHGGVHMLAIFDPEKTSSDINSLLGAVGYRGNKSYSDSVTTKSITEVVDIITEHGGIAIPAHIDKDKGLFEESGVTLEQILGNTNIYAMELCDTDYNKPQLYIDKKIQWTEIKGSDVHDFRKQSLDFTWVKMDKPSIEGLKLALIDNKASVNRNMSANPNQHADFIIEELHINNAKYIGRPNTLECKFSPFLNTIIGGRGSGKSTLLEFMRFVLRRDKEIPDTLKNENYKYFQVDGDDSLLTSNSILSLIYNKNGTCYRLNWSADGSANSLEVYDNGDWKVDNGEIKSLFPVHIYSQKQIIEISKNQQALLDIIDKDEKITFNYFKEQHNLLTHKYKQIQQKIIELTEKIAQKNKLQGIFKDLDRQIDKIEESGHKLVLQNYRKRQQQLNTIKNIETDWQDMIDLLKDTAESVKPVNFNEQTFSEHNNILLDIKTNNEKWHDINKKIAKLIVDAQHGNRDWQQKKEQVQWMKELKNDVSKYEQIKTQLEQQGINPEKYPSLLQQKTLTKKELFLIEDYSEEIILLKDKRNKIFKKIEENREKLTKNRQDFLDGILQDNKEVNIKVMPFKEQIDSVEAKIRNILQCRVFDKDIDVLMEAYKVDNDFKALKVSIKKINDGEDDSKDSRFYGHLKNLPQESLIDFKLWFPKDDLEITFGSDNKKIKQGSPGQKCAALLAFILSYGDTPLLLDQPEDDLDNELIYDLIVKQIRATKNKRQIIIVTHNANIVVNGDAEMVLPLTVGGGKTHIKEAASIQNKQIRDKICTILEGGQHAFNQRYKRIHLE